MELLLAWHADVNVKDKRLVTPLHVAASVVSHESEEICRRLLNRKAKICVPNYTGATPLHIALQRPYDMGRRDSHYGDPALTLLNHPSLDITARDSHLRTPLHLAALHHNVPATELLLSKSASPNCTDKYGKTPLSYAPNPHIALLLLDHGANVNHAEPNGWTPVHRAIERCWVNAFEVLVRNGADLEARTTDDELSARERMRRMGGFERWVRRESEFLIEDVEMEKRRVRELRG